MKYTDICKRLYEASLQAGVVALAMQKDIVNEGKYVEQEEGEDEFHLAMRQAKTKVDVMVQDMLLSAVRMYKDELSLDVEEESQLIPLFTRQDFETTLIMDPIDGTLDYLHQKDTYSICSGVFHEGQVMAVVVYFPKRDLLYCYEESLGVRYFSHAQSQTWEDGEVIPEGNLQPIVYKNDRVSTTYLQQWMDAGYQVRDDRTCNCPEALIACLHKEALCYVSHTRNIRDILMGAILCKCEDGALLDEFGKEITWPSHGRLPFGVFTRFSNLVTLNSQK